MHPGNGNGDDDGNSSSSIIMLTQSFVLPSSSSLITIHQRNPAELEREPVPIHVHPSRPVLPPPSP